MAHGTFLLLDIDGTLIDSFRGIRHSLLTALDEIGVDRPGEDVLAGIAGPPMEETLRSLGLDEPTVRRGLRSYLNHFGDSGWSMSAPYPGAAEFLARMTRREGLTVATASSKGEGFARQTLEHYELLDHLDFLGAAQENGPRRSKIAVLDYVIDALGIDPARDTVVLVGDRIHDFEAAHKRGLATIAATWGYGSEDEYAEARFRARDFADTERILDEHFF